MLDLSLMGKYLLWTGILFLVLGGALLAFGKIPFLGRLPGDIHVERANFSFYFPIVTCLLLSVVLSVILWLFNRLK